MRFIPTRLHAILDYLLGAVMIVLPWLADFAAGGAETWIFVILGAGVILYSLFTDYEYALSRNIPMPTHLGLDIAGGVVLAASPWLFGFADFVYWPHVIFGALEVGAGLMTQRVPSTQRPMTAASRKTVEGR